MERYTKLMKIRENTLNNKAIEQILKLKKRDNFETVKTKAYETILNRKLNFYSPNFINKFYHGEKDRLDVYLSLVESDKGFLSIPVAPRRQDHWKEMLQLYTNPEKLAKYIDILDRTMPNIIKSISFSFIPAIFDLFLTTDSVDKFMAFVGYFFDDQINKPSLGYKFCEAAFCTAEFYKTIDLIFDMMTITAAEVNSEKDAINFFEMFLKCTKTLQSLDYLTYRIINLPNATDIVENSFLKLAVRNPHLYGLALPEERITSGNISYLSGHMPKNFSLRFVKKLQKLNLNQYNGTIIDGVLSELPEIANVRLFTEDELFVLDFIYQIAYGEAKLEKELKVSNDFKLYRLFSSTQAMVIEKKSMSKNELLSKIPHFIAPPSDANTVRYSYNKIIERSARYAPSSFALRSRICAKIINEYGKAGEDDINNENVSYDDLLTNVEIALNLDVSLSKARTMIIHMMYAGLYFDLANDAPRSLPNWVYCINEKPDPHFFTNLSNSIASYCKKNNLPNIPEMVRFWSLVRLFDMDKLIEQNPWVVSADDRFINIEVHEETKENNLIKFQNSPEITSRIAARVKCAYEMTSLPNIIRLFSKALALMANYIGKPLKFIDMDVQLPLMIYLTNQAKPCHAVSRALMVNNLIKVLPQQTSNSVCLFGTHISIIVSVIIREDEELKQYSKYL